MIEEAPAIAYRKLINRGGQHAMATDSSDIAPVGSEVEAVGNGSPVNDFWRKRGWSVSADVSQALGPHVTGLQRQSATAAVVQLRLKPLIVDVSFILR